MLILFLIFIVQFALACVCLAMNEEQVRSLVEGSWNSASSSTRAMVQERLNCCGFIEQGQGHPSCSKVCTGKICEVEQAKQ